MTHHFEILKNHAPVEAHSFLQKVVTELDGLNVEMVVSEDLQVFLDNFYSAGYFSDSPPTLALAVGKPFEDWFLVFIHEYCHFKQYQDNPEKFHEDSLKIEKLFAWVDGGELTQEEIDEFSSVARYLEYDCERRVLANLDNFGITHLINTREYAQKANSYFNFYNYVAAHRVWYVGGREPYSIKSIWSEFSTELLIETHLSPERAELFAQCV